MRRAVAAKISQSALASPGGSMAARMSWMRRSEFTVVPAFSGHCADGSTTCASALVSVGWYASWAMTSSALRSALRARSASGIDTAGFVAQIQTALIRPSSSASNRSVAGRPTFGEMLPAGRPQCASTSAR